MVDFTILRGFDRCLPKYIKIIPECLKRQDIWGKNFQTNIERDKIENISNILSLI